MLRPHLLYDENESFVRLPMTSYNASRTNRIVLISHKDSNCFKMDIETFYGRLRNKFPELNTLSVWNEWDWRNEGAAHSVIMSEVARKLIRWAESNNWPIVAELLNEVEIAFGEGDETVVAFLGTDFTVTIMECRVQHVRERIKKMMGKITWDAYKINLGGYREL